METSVKKRNSSIDLLRMIACALVITVHASSFVGGMYISDRAWFFVHIYNTLGHAGNILFLMISGSLLLPENYRFDAKTFYTHNFLKLLTAYFLWLILYNSMEILHTSAESSEKNFPNILLAAVKNMFEGIEGVYFWFLPMLMGLYLLLPMLRAICRTKGVTSYFMALFFVVSVLSPTILYFEFPYKYIYEFFETRIPFTLVNHYTGYFVMGHWLSVLLKEKKFRAVDAYLLGGVFIVFGVLGSLGGDYILAKQRGEFGSTSMNDLFSIGPCIIAVGFFLLINNIKLPEARIFSSALEKLAGLTFGVYMLHPLFLPFFQTLIQKSGLPVIFEIPLTVLALSFVCMAVTYVLSLIPFLRKWLLFMGDKK